MGQYKFYCNVPGCDKKYNTRSNLEVHMRKHQGIRPFVCDKCGKRYISKWNMAKHQRKGCNSIETKIKEGMENFQRFPPTIKPHFRVTKMEQKEAHDLRSTYIEGNFYDKQGLCWVGNQTPNLDQYDDLEFADIELSN